MKITAKHYAQSLYEALKDSDRSKTDKIIKNFIKLLEKNRDLKLENEIIAKFSKIYNKDRGYLTADVTTVRELSPAEEQALTEKIKELSQAKWVELNKKIDPEIIGGVIISFKNTFIDASIKKYLNNLKNNI